MTSRVLKESDYETLVDWWKWWRFPVIDKSLLPNNGLGGFMVEENGLEIAAGFLYFTNSGFALCEFVVSNPNVKDRKLREDALVFLINEITAEAKNNGVRCLFTYIKNSNLEKKYLKSGYKLGTKGSNELIKIIE